MMLLKILVEDQEQVDKFLDVITEAEENGETGDYFTIHVSVAQVTCVYGHEGTKKQCESCTFLLS